MCFDLDSSPPIPPLRGAAVTHERLELTASDGNRFSAFEATPEQRGAAAVVILPDVRGLYRFYEELALRFAERGIGALAFDYFGRTAGTGTRDDDFDYMPHVQQVDPAHVRADVAAAIERLRSNTGAGPIFTVGFCFGGSHSWRLSATDLDLAGVTSRAAFLKRCAERIPLPEYFGGNWDALHESLLDLAAAGTPGAVVHWRRGEALAKRAPEVVDTALAEDMRYGVDATSNATVPLDSFAVAELTTRKSGVIAGIPVALAVFEAILGKPADILDRVADGAIFGGFALWYAGRGDDNVLCAVSIFCLASGQVVSYTKARGESIGLPVAVNGLVERAERLVISLVALLLLSGLERWTSRHAR